MSSAAKREDFLHVPYGLTVHGEAEEQAVLKVLRSSTQMGAHVRQMEEKTAALLGKKHGLMVNSGSSALLLAALVSGLPKGSEVITPALTFATTVSSLVQAGLVPSFVDSEADTFCMDAEKVERAITPNTRAMCVPNLLGNLPDWPMLAEIAKRHGLLVIEDSADTLGATLSGKASGAWSDMSITSFYGSHVINCAGNGGMLCVNDESQLTRAKLLRSWGRSSSLYVDSEAVENRFDIEIDGIAYDKKFVFEALGYNLEPSELGAAFGLVQLEKLAANIKAREANFARQLAFFKAYEEFFLLPRQRPESRTGWLAFPLVVREGAPFTRRDMQIFLERRNIQTRVIFTGNILRQPGFKGIECRGKADDFTQADAVMRGGILLACHHGLTEPMFAHVHESVALFMRMHT